MVSRSKTSLLLASFLFFVLLPSSFAAVSVPQKPDSYIVDIAGVVDQATKQKLNRYLRELERKTTAQLVVLTIVSLEGEALEDFSIRIAHDQWKLGQHGKDNGALLVISVKDRKYRIEVGYGLEGALPDSLVGSIGRNYLVPFFKKGDYSNGVAAAVLVLANEIAKNAGVVISDMPKTISTGNAAKPPSLFRKIIFGLFFIILFFFFLKNPRAFLLFLMFSSMGGGRQTWGGGGGGFGGGGGGFGGGGASGSW